MSRFWAEDELEHVKLLYSQGLSRGKIATEMNTKFAGRKNYTRNSLIGIISRMKIANGYKPEPRKPGLTKVNVSANRPKRPQKSWRAVIPYKVEPLYQAKGTCQFITSDGSPWVKCGKDSHGSWCEEHQKLVTLDRRSVGARPAQHPNIYSWNKL